MTAEFSRPLLFFNLQIYVHTWCQEVVTVWDYLLFTWHGHFHRNVCMRLGRTMFPRIPFLIGSGLGFVSERNLGDLQGGREGRPLFLGVCGGQVRLLC